MAVPSPPARAMLGWVRPRQSTSSAGYPTAPIRNGRIAFLLLPIWYAAGRGSNLPDAAAMGKKRLKKIVKKIIRKEDNNELLKKYIDLVKLRGERDNISIITVNCNSRDGKSLENNFLSKLFKF